MTTKVVKYAGTKKVDSDKHFYYVSQIGDSRGSSLARIYGSDGINSLPISKRGCCPSGEDW